MKFIAGTDIVDPATLPTKAMPEMPVVHSRARGGIIHHRADASPGLATNTYNFATPPPNVVNDGMGNYFEALRVSQDRSGIPYAMIHLRPQILRLLNGLNRKLLAAVGRYLVDNGGVASYAVDTIANYSMPVRPHSVCEDKEAAKVYEDYFDEWAKRCDFTRRFNFDELQRIACRAIDSDGDIGVVITAKSGFPQIRFFDTFHIGTLTGLDPKDGIVADDYGVMQGYRVCDGPIDTLQSIANTFIPIEQMLLLRDPDRYDHFRGYSPIRRGSNDLRDENDIKAFTKLKEKIGTALAAVIQQKGMLEEDVWGDDSGTKGVAATVEGDPNATPPEKKLSLAELLGGDIPIIEGEIKQLEHKSPGVDAVDFMQFLAGQFVAGLGIPPAFFLDEKLTGPNVRAVLGKVQRKFDQRKAVMAKLVEFCWLRVIAWGIANDSLPSKPGWWKITFQFPPMITIDLGDVMTNERQDVMVGQMSEKERFGNRGKDQVKEHAQIVEEVRQKVADAVKIQQEFKDSNIPIEVLLSRFGFNISMRATLNEPPPEEPAGTESNAPARTSDKKQPAKKK
jgi:hypothetical protein